MRELAPDCQMVHAALTSAGPATGPATCPRRRATPHLLTRPAARHGAASPPRIRPARGARPRRPTPAALAAEHHAAPSTPTSFPDGPSHGDGDTIVAVATGAKKKGEQRRLAASSRPSALFSSSSFSIPHTSFRLSQPRAPPPSASSAFPARPPWPSRPASFGPPPGKGGPPNRTPSPTAARSSRGRGEAVA